jgi:hypothetical protein
MVAARQACHLVAQVAAQSQQTSGSARHIRRRNASLPSLPGDQASSHDATPSVKSCKPGLHGETIAPLK